MVSVLEQWQRLTKKQVDYNGPTLAYEALPYTPPEYWMYLAKELKVEPVELDLSLFRPVEATGISCYASCREITNVSRMIEPARVVFRGPPLVSSIRPLIEGGRFVAMLRGRVYAGASISFSEVYLSQRDTLLKVYIDDDPKLLGVVIGVAKKIINDGGVI